MNRINTPIIINYLHTSKYKKKNDIVIYKNAILFYIIQHIIYAVSTQHIA